VMKWVRNPRMVGGSRTLDEIHHRIEL